MENHLPKSSDKLFKDEVDPRTGAWLKNPANKFFLYSEGYKEAGRRLYEFCRGNPFYNNSLIYPLVFNYRQFLELRIKELIIMGYKYLDDPEGDFPDEHSLSILWEIYRNEILPHIDNTIDEKILDNVEKLINEFNSLDPNSMHFRYPVTKRLKKTRKQSLNRSTIDLSNFKVVMEKLIFFLDWQWEMIANYEDFKQEEIANMFIDYWH